MERHCLNCVWFNKEKIHCDYEFGTSHYKPYCLDDDNNFIDDNEELIQDINILQDFRCHKYYERPPKIINPMDLLQDYKNIVDKIKEHIKTELEKRYKDIRFDDDIGNALIVCTINNHIYCNIGLVDKYIYIQCYNELVSDVNDFENVETFEELFKYIDDVISEEA
ncbi:hypothetical protein [uncultured Brachyspira sp.]|uniref:hypothetical protein n=1 Tax=uncultured Brachyspira sp. TaxID=221953 RepID=UPI00258703E5|nr:hypothetical protein [uncultured Brachyspira sp.]